MTQPLKAITFDFWNTIACARSGTRRRPRARTRLLGHFSGWAFSDEVGRYKPSPQIFKAALSALGATPAEAMHVGDLRRTDIAGASAIGMVTARYRGLHDDRGEGAGPEADFVVDSHRELPDLIGRIG